MEHFFLWEGEENSRQTTDGDPTDGDPTDGDIDSLNEKTQDSDASATEGGQYASVSADVLSGLVSNQDRSQSTKKVLAATPPVVKKVISVEGFVCLIVVAGLVSAIGIVMGFSNAINSIFATSYHLLTDTVWYLLAIVVIMGALSEVLSEFGVVSLANKIFSPLMQPLFGMPGATSVAILSSFLSDNPAILTLTENAGYRRYFKKYQLGALTNIGTTYGMGLIVVVTMMSLKAPDGSNFIWQPLIGVFSVFVSSILITRLMLCFTKKKYGKDEPSVSENESAVSLDISHFREVRSGSVFSRLFSALLDGGQNGVKIGMGLIPGVLIISTFVLMLSNGRPADGIYTGAYGEGIGLIPLIGDWLSPVLKPLFGFSSPSDIAVPLTSLGSAGAALGLLKSMTLTSNTAAVFTAMAMFWSGYLSTHVSMMDSLKMRELTGKAILYHTIGGFIAGLLANGLVSLILLL